MGEIIEFPKKSKFESMINSKATNMEYNENKHEIITTTESGKYKFKLDPWQTVEKDDNGNIFIS